MGRKTAKMFRKLLAILTICTLITLMFPGLVLAEEDVPEEDPIVENGATGEEGEEPEGQDEGAPGDQGEEPEETEEVEGEGPVEEEVVGEVDAPSEWAVPEINLAIENGLVTEKVLGNYQDDITREDFCELIVKLYGALSGEEAQIPEENVFTDTENEEILKANALGIVRGKTDTEFFPNDKITREEIAVMFYRTLNAVHPSLVAESFEVVFEDIDEISDWAMEAIGFMSNKGIIKGMDGNMVAPKANTLREQAIALVYRTYELFKDVEIEEPIAEEEVEAEEPVEGEAEEEPVEDGSEEGDGNGEDEPEEGEENDEEPVDEETEE